VDLLVGRISGHLMENSEGRRSLGRPVDVDGRTILNWILEK
jgi:hypothetical protein